MKQRKEQRIALENQQCKHCQQIIKIRLKYIEEYFVFFVLNVSYAILNHIIENDFCFSMFLRVQDLGSSQTRILFLCHLHPSHPYWYYWPHLMPTTQAYWPVFEQTVYPKTDLYEKSWMINSPNNSWYMYIV